ncbi:MAG: YybS family protein [Bacteriovoracaceae bacterium]|nr:YybS family protein [Bacteriovoracaceae bacterium]
MTTEILQQPKLGISRWLLLGASSVVLCLSYLMAIFTPFPLAIATVLYGRMRGYSLMLAGLLLCVALGASGVLDYTLASSYFLLSFFAVVISETMLRSWKPVRSLVATGIVFLVLFAGGLTSYVKAEKKTIMEIATIEVSKVITKLEEAKKAGTFQQDLSDLGLARPAGEIAQEILRTIPGYLVMGVFFILWVNTYLVLKGRRLLQPAVTHEFDENHLLSFKVPFAGAYVVAISLAMAVWGNQLIPVWGEVIGMLLLQTIGVFYFFQGFGVTLNFLNHFQILGFLRTIFVMGVVFFIPWMVAVLGIFDTWFDFNNKFKKKVSN